MENEKTVQLLNQGVFSLSVDGGSKRLSKAYVFDPDQGKVAWKMLDVGTLGIEDRATGENIFALVEEAVSSNGLKWERCLALSVDKRRSCQVPTRVCLAGCAACLPSGWLCLSPAEHYNAGR